MERRKYLGRANGCIKSFKSKVMRVDEEGIQGCAAMMRVEEVHKPLIFGDTCLYDHGYSELFYLPDGEHWHLSVIYDEKRDIVEWYFDITRKNALDEAGKPYCDDLYLDATLMPDGRVLVFDEDELREALERGEVTREEYDMAYETLDALKAKGIFDVAYMETLCARLGELFA